MFSIRRIVCHPLLMYSLALYPPMALSPACCRMITISGMEMSLMHSMVWWFLWSGGFGVCLAAMVPGSLLRCGSADGADRARSGWPLAEKWWGKMMCSSPGPVEGLVFVVRRNPSSPRLFVITAKDPVRGLGSDCPWDVTHNRETHQDGTRCAVIHRASSYCTTLLR